MAAIKPELHILLVEDNEDDYILTRNLLNKAFPQGYDLQWINNYDDSISAARSRPLDICLIDYRLGSKDGLDLVKALDPYNPRTPPIIILTGMDRRDFDLKAIQLGVADCLFKDQLTAALLERAIHYALARKQTEQALRESELRHRNLLNNIAEGIITIDAQGIVTSFNPAASEIFGYEAEEIVGRSVNLLMPNPYGKEHDDYIQRYLRTGEVHILNVPRELNGCRKNGEIFPLEISVSEIEVEGNVQFSSVVRDITERKRAEDELRLAATTFDIHAAIMITDSDGNILRVNNAFTNITGYSAAEVAGENPRMLQSGKQSPEFYDEMWRHVNEEGQWEGELWNKRKNGEVYPEWQTITAVTNVAGEVINYIATFQDITERKKAQALIERQALYDTLTDLPNRRFFLDRLQQELAGVRRREVCGAVLFVDLDHFKSLNDSLGHAAGDVLLQKVARRLVSNVRAEDTVARLGGDEFVVLLPHLHRSEEQSGILVQSIAEKLREAISAPYDIQGHHHVFSPSIGIALFSSESESADDVLRHADTAMYRAKHEGRNRVRFYRPSMQAAADARLVVETDLRHAINQGQFVLYYQPQVDTAGGVIGVEALLRWRHPKHGIILPGEFIGIAEENGMIVPIGEWVLEHAMQQFVVWNEAGYLNGNEYLAVNISHGQLQDNNFVDKVRQLLRETKMNPQALKLELVESVFMDDADEAVLKMQALKKLGVRFAIDDFGSGYSSLACLKRLPLDQLKIDKSFVMEAAADKSDAAIVETIIAMARHLNLDVLAEGVETQEVLDLLEASQCSHFQGFYFSQSLSSDEMVNFLKRSRQIPVEAQLRK
jgi:diguanylate cyclase (GGDEF)-like protein/PAS domain S-box-containing protein